MGTFLLTEIKSHESNVIRVIIGVRVGNNIEVIERKGRSQAAVQWNGLNTGWGVRRSVLIGPGLVSRPDLAAILAVLS